MSEPSGIQTNGINMEDLQKTNLLSRNYFGFMKNA